MTTKVLKNVGRKYQVIDDEAKILYILEQHTSYRTLHVKNEMPPLNCEMSKVDREKGLCAVKFDQQPDVDKTISLYCTLKKHLEFDFKVVKQLENNVLVLRPFKTRIAEDSRHYQRYIVSPGLVTARNYSLSKNRIDLNRHTPLVTNKIIFSEFARSLSTRYPGIEILDHGIENEAFENSLLKKFSKPLYIADLQNSESYTMKDERFINPAEHLFDDVDKMVLQSKDKGMKSLLCIPVIYENLAGENFPIGYIRYYSQAALDAGNVIREFEEVGRKIVDKIKDANSVDFNITQNIVNVSEHGAALLIEDKELMKYITQRDYFLTDIVFRMQSPIRLYCHICYIMEYDLPEDDATANGDSGGAEATVPPDVNAGSKKPKKGFLVGVSFDGKAFHESRSNLKDCLAHLKVS